MMQYWDSAMSTDAGRMIVAVLAAALILSLALTSVKMFLSIKLTRGSITAAVAVALFVVLMILGVFDPLMNLDLSWIRMPS